MSEGLLLAVMCVCGERTLLWPRHCRDLLTYVALPHDLGVKVIRPSVALPYSSEDRPAVEHAHAP